MVRIEDLVAEAQVSEASDSRPDFKVYTVEDALAPLPPIEWVVQDLLPAGSLSVVYGGAGSKKTYSMIDLAVCAALGKPWLDFPTQRGPVLFIDEEMGPRYLRERIASTIRGHLGNKDMPLYYTSLAGFDLGKLGGVNDLHLLAVELNARLVIIDALVDVMPGLDENATQDAGPVIKHLKALANTTGSAIVVVHHANKSGGYRGSSAIKGGVDLMLKVESKVSSEIVQFSTEKPRLIPAVSFAARAVWQEGEFSLVTAEDRAGEEAFLGKAQVYVLGYLALQGESPIKDIKQNAETVSPDSARQAVYNLRDMSLVERTNPGDGRNAKYGLTSRGLERAAKEGFDTKQNRTQKV
jgi:hypothetical protein